MRKTTIAMVVPALLLWSAPLGAQQVSGQATAQAQASARTPEQRIEAAMQAAARANVPASLLESKVAEGEAKRVPQERIAAAVEARASALIRASEVMQRAEIAAQGAAQLSVAADALTAGVSESALIEVSREAAPERRTVAVAVLADLVRLGTTSELALTRVSAALTSNAALANLQAEVASQLRLGGQQSTIEAGGILRIQ